MSLPLWSESPRLIVTSVEGLGQEDGDLRTKLHSKTLSQKKTKKEIGKINWRFCGKVGIARLPVGGNYKMEKGPPVKRTAAWLLPAELNVVVLVHLTLQDSHSESLFHLAGIWVCDLNDHRDRRPLTPLNKSHSNLSTTASPPHRQKPGCPASQVLVQTLAEDTPGRAQPPRTQYCAGHCTCPRPTGRDFRCFVGERKDRNLSKEC